MEKIITWTVSADDKPENIKETWESRFDSHVVETIKTIEKIKLDLDAERSKLEDLDTELTDLDPYNEDIDIAGEITQAAAEVESVVDNIEKVLQALKSPKTEYAA